MVEWITTSTILRGLRDFDNDAAWQRLVARFHRPIVSFARGVGLTRPDAEDVAQETLVAFAESYRNGRYDREKGRLSRWLFGIAYRQILREQRRRARQGVLVPGGPDFSFWVGVADEQATARWDQEWEQSLLEACLQRARREFQPETYRAFELVVHHDRPAAEVADLLNVSAKSVYNAKHRVLKRVRELRAELEAVE